VELYFEDSTYTSLINWPHKIKQCDNTSHKFNKTLFVFKTHFIERELG